MLIYKFNSIIFGILIFTPFINSHLLEGIYCGKENCYDVLGVTRDATRNEISKNYRQLARKHHPDTHKTDEAKRENEEIFKKIATAYEILRDDESRTDYDYMLDNPDQYYLHYYRYYRKRVAPKVDVRLVIFVTVSIISIVQYLSAKQRYESAINYFMSVPKYRNKAMEMLHQQQSSGNNNNKNKGRNKLSKAEQKLETEKEIRKIIIENMDIQGSYAKPEIVDILFIQIIIFPYTFVKYLIWYFSWIWNYTILGKEYGREEKLYIIRKFMKMGHYQFNAIENEKKEEFLYRKLWIKENYKEWKHEQEEEMKKQMADNPRYKAYRRYMKNHGPGRMTFED
uniref:Putative molecular chaperone dnaj superfamily n=1 Tax=Corethrella appendiculata TaxID=1370023 RepID=U5ETT1_9DIPT